MFPVATWFPSAWVDANVWVLVVGLAAAFGGFVHGISRPVPVEYSFELPLRGTRAKFGVVGDLIVGAAAGLAIFFVMDSLFGLKPDAKDQQTYLRALALGVICGYLGIDLLRLIALQVFKSTMKKELDVEQSKRKIEELQGKVQAAAKAADMMALGDAYSRWAGKYPDLNLFDRALESIDEAIRTDPGNPGHLIKKSIVYADKAHGKSQRDGRALYETAIALASDAIALDRSCARAYYDRACYKQLMGEGKSQKGRSGVLDDLKKAINLNDTMRKMAQLDPDFETLREDHGFKKLVQTESKSAAQRPGTAAIAS